METRLRIGVQTNEIESGFNLEALGKLTIYCAALDIDLIIIPCGSTRKDEYEYQQASVFGHVKKENIDGLILLAASMKEYLSFTSQNGETADKINLPTICVAEPNQFYTSIWSDATGALTELITHLITVHHCSKFNLITGPRDNTSSNDRTEICKHIFRDKGITLEKRRIFTGDYEAKSGFSAMTYFAENNLLDTDCIICLNDDMATGVISYADSHQLHIPEDFLLTGFDNILQCSHTTPTLTTIDQNICDICELAVDSLLNLINGKQIPPELRVPSRVLYRQSCGCISCNDLATSHIENGKKILFDPHYYRDFGARYFSLENDVILLQNLMTDFSSVQAVDNVFVNMRHMLPTLGISTCAIVLFENKIIVRKGERFHLPSTANVMLCYDSSRKDTRKYEFEPLSFNPSERYLPDGIFSDRRRTLFIKALSFKEAQFGYVVYEPGNLNICIYDTIFTELSTTLNSSLIFTEKLKIEKNLTNLLMNLESSNNELSSISYTDELTKLYNRRALLYYGQDAIDTALMNQRKGIVVFSDMDGLKTINDTYGHDAGDVAIKTMAEILKKVFRTGDIIARIGGDEFVIVAAGVDSSFVAKIEYRIDAAIRLWKKTTAEQFTLSISIGAVDFTDEKHNLEDLLSNADKILYDVKRHKKASRSYDPGSGPQ